MESSSSNGMIDDFFGHGFNGFVFRKSAPQMIRNKVCRLDDGQAERLLTMFVDRLTDGC
jgi:hypothetical protein